MSETICAISTALGEGAIGIVRLSGDEAFSIAEKIVRLPKGKTVESLASHTINYGNVVDPATNEKIEEIIFLYVFSLLIKLYLKLLIHSQL